MAQTKKTLEVFGNENRKNIYEMIKDNPGMPYHELRKTSKICSNILVHHLDVLVEKGYVFTKGEGSEKAYFPVKKGESKGLNPRAKEVVEYIRNHPNGIERAEASAGLRMRRSLLQQFAQELEREGYIDISEQGSFVFYYPKN